MRRFICLLVIATLGVSYRFAAAQRYNLPPEDMQSRGRYQRDGSPGTVPRSREIVAVANEYVQQQFRTRGFITVQDPTMGRARRLVLVAPLNKRPERDGDRYIVRGIFRDQDNGMILAVDIYVEKKDGELQVVGTLIKKEGGRKRRPNEIGELPETESTQ